MKNCSSCKKHKPITSKYFVRNKNSKDGFHNQCKECSRKRNKDFMLYQRTGWRVKDKEKTWLAQNKQCAMCHLPIQLTAAKADHDHITNLTRAILCAKCNSGLGYVEDKQFMELASSYLSSHAAKS